MQPLWWVGVSGLLEFLLHHARIQKNVLFTCESNAEEEASTELKASSLHMKMAYSTWLNLVWENGKKGGKKLLFFISVELIIIVASAAVMAASEHVLNETRRSCVKKKQLLRCRSLILKEKPQISTGKRQTKTKRILVKFTREKTHFAELKQKKNGIYKLSHALTSGSRVTPGVGLFFFSLFSLLKEYIGFYGVISHSVKVL